MEGDYEPTAEMVHWTIEGKNEETKKTRKYSIVVPEQQISISQDVVQ